MLALDAHICRKELDVIPAGRSLYIKALFVCKFAHRSQHFDIVVSDFDKFVLHERPFDGVHLQKFLNKVPEG